MSRVMSCARWLTVVAALLFPCLSISPARADIFSETQAFTLENGMQVVVIPDRGSPVVTHMVWYRVGSADEAPGESGLAHFLEHLMFRGTEKIAPNEFSLIISRNGGTHNAETNYDYTCYYQRVAKELLPLVMELEADRMVNLMLRPEEVEPEREVVMEERREAVDNDPAGRFGEQMSAAFYLSHPYGSPIVGWMHEIERLGEASARAFYEKHYAPNNAILVVAGDLTVEEVRSLAETHYGALEANPAIGLRARPAEAPHQAAIRMEMSDPRMSFTMLVRRYLVPSLVTSPDEALALQVLGDLFGANTTSRLYRTLVVERGLATGAGVVGSVDDLDNGEFVIYGLVAPGVDAETFESALDDMIADLIANGVTDSEVERSKRMLAASSILTADDQEELARVYGVTLVNGGTIDDVRQWPERIRAVTREEVEAVAQRYLRIEQSITGILSPAAVAQ